MEGRQCLTHQHNRRTRQSTKTTIEPKRLHKIKNSQTSKIMARIIFKTQKLSI